MADNMTPADQTGRDVKTAGTGFAQLLDQLGQSVAQTQVELNDITADTALALSGTMVEVIAARQKVYSDDGTQFTEHELTMNMPLVAYVDVVNHEVAQMHIQGVFQSNGFSNQVKTSTGSVVDTGSAQLHIGGIFSSPSTSSALAQATGAVAAGSTSGPRYGTSSTTNMETEYGSRSQTSYGQVRMNAEFRPRTDIGVPKPNHVIRGPELTLVPVRGVEIKDAQGLVTERQMIMRVLYRRRPAMPADKDDGSVPAVETPVAGDPIENAMFAFEAPGLRWTPCDSNGVAQIGEAFSRTGKNGTMYVLLTRSFAPADVERSEKPFVFTARIGMIYANTAVSL